MGLFRSRGSRDDGIDFAPLLPIDSGAVRPLQESDRVYAMSLRVQSIAAVLDPTPRADCLTKAIPDDASTEDVTELANQRPKGWVIRDVTALAEIPETAQKFAGISRVIIPKGADDRLAEISPTPPYFTDGARKRMRRVQEMAALGYYWGWEEMGEGWQHRGPGNPDVHDIRGPDDVTQYDQLCPRVRWETDD
jgi:hypothetical protein